MTHHDEAVKAVSAYLDACQTANELHAAICVRALIEAATKTYASCTTAQQAYETLAAIALDTFNADVTSRKQAAGGRSMP